MRDRLPLTYTATLPFFGPAVNHMANDLPLTVKVRAAPVVDVAQTLAPKAFLVGACFHGADTLTALTEVVVIVPPISTATTARARFEKCMPPSYLPIFRLHRHLGEPKRLSSHRLALG